MLKRRIPFALAETVYEIPFSFYERLGVKTIFLDLDNTLVPYSVACPDARSQEWCAEAKRKGFRIIILSNNTGKRVSRFAESLGVEYSSMMRKPFSGPLKKFMRKAGLEPAKCIMIGDQIMTDVTACGGAGVRCILTEPLDSREPPWTRFNRFFDRPKRKKIKRLQLAKSWREKRL